MKKIMVTFLAVLSLILSAAPAYAAEVSNHVNETAMTPNYTYIWLLSSGLDISSSGKAHCVGSVDASSNSYNAELTVTLQKYSNGSWSNVKSWSDSGTGQSNLIVDKYYYVERGTYRVRTTAKIYDSAGKLLEDKFFDSDERTY
ncbi:MAG: hypothetical protein VB064_05385 [Oscillospiraceae bacterium]|nr:hypothetical protein [Oscillospiraceae bacterium]